MAACHLLINLLNKQLWERSCRTVGGVNCLLQQLQQQRQSIALKINLNVNCEDVVEDVEINWWV